MDDRTRQRPRQGPAPLPSRVFWAFLIPLTLTACTPPPEGPGLVLTEGVVYHGDLERTASALAIDGDRVVAIGTDEEIRELALEDTQEMALDGAAVLPGLVDAWVDLVALGREDVIDLTLTASPREVQARLREASADGNGWIVGRGWDETIWPRPILPSRDEIEAAVAERPVMLLRAGGDMGWVNAAALRAAGLLETDGDVVAGLRAGPEGKPTGIVAGPALDRVLAAIPSPDRTARRDILAAASRRIAAAGITTATTAPIGAADVDALRALEREGDLSVRVRGRLALDALPTDPESDDARRLLAPSELVRIVAVGVTVDGPFGPGSAALSTPDSQGREGSLWTSRSEIAEACAAAEELNLELHARARGDRAVSAVREACPALRAGGGLLVGADLLPEPAPDVPPTAVTPLRMAHDLYWLEEILGNERAGRTHPYRDLLATGALVGIATEAPGWPLEPLAAIRVMATRRDREGYPIDGWVPTQRIAMTDAFRVATGQLRRGAEPLAVGSVADLVVFSGDPLQGTEDLGTLRAMVTIVAGRVVYSRPLVDLPFEME